MHALKIPPVPSLAIPTMRPREFLNEWDLTYPELAELLGVSLSTVESWLSGRRQPLEPAERLLSMIHQKWLEYENEPQDQREIYERKPRRKNILPSED